MTAAGAQTVERAGPIELPGECIVLLVDDQAIVGHAVRQMLAPETDIRFHFCQDPLKAVAMANELSPTVILQDLVMPEVDGLTLLKFFRSNAATRETPMIVLSSKEEPATKAQAFGLGANDYLVKLPDRVELVARIRHHSRGYIAQLQRNEAYRKLAESEQRLADDIAQAARYVQSLLPPPMAHGPVRIGWRFVPSTQLGGDAFGYTWLDDEHLSIYLLDVSGHGVGSSLLAVSALNVLAHRTLPNIDFRNPAAVMEGLNVVFDMSKHSWKYFTIWYGVFHAPTRKLTFSGGGHPPAFLFSGNSAADAALQRLECPGPVIGMSNNLPFENIGVDLLPWSRLFIYSDGAVEVDMPDGNMGDLDQFIEFVTASGPLDELMDMTLRRARDLRGGDILNDDCSLMLADLHQPA